MRRSTVPRYAQTLKPQAKPKQQSYRHVAFRRIKHLVFALLIIISGCFTGLTLRDYHHSLDWSKNKNGLKMAEMSPDMLQDSPRQIAVKEDFIKRANKMLKSDGQIEVTKNDLDALKKDLSKIKIAKPQYEKRYHQIADKYMVKNTLKKLTKNNTVTVNANEVHKALITVGPILNSIHQKYPNDKFVEQEMIIIHNLNHDMKLIKQLLGGTAQLVTIDKRTAVFKPSVIYDNYKQAMQPQDKLIYKWSMLVPLINLERDVKDVLDSQEQKINTYNAYRQDLRDKDRAYEDLRKARETHAANNAQVIERQRQEKIAKEQQKAAEEAERRRQEEQARQDQENQNKQDQNKDTNQGERPKDDNSTSQKPHKQKPKKKPKDHFVDPDKEMAVDGTD